MADWTSLSYAVVDVEGNGQQPPDLVELAVVPIVGGKIGEPRSWLVRPERPIKYFAARVHGLTNDDVADQPPFATVADEVRAALVVPALVAHNAYVDTGVLARELGTRLFVHLATASGGEPLTLEELRNKPVPGSDDEASALF